MSNDTIEERVNKILVDEFEVEESMLNPHAQLFDELGLDSLDSVDLVVALEQEFCLKYNRARDEVKIRQMRSLKDVCDFVEFKQKETVSQKQSEVSSDRV